MESVSRFWSHEASNIRCVREADYDAALGEIAALQQSEKLAQETVTLALSTGLRVSRENEALQQRLTAADQRVDDQASLIAELIAGWDAAQFGDPPTRLAKAIKSARLNPTTEAASHDE